LNKQVSSATLTKLKNADINNNYNETYQAVMKQKLKSYQNSLQQAYVKTKNVAGKKVLTKDYDSAELLLKMLPATTN
jgi:negative regulator of sigma E activity